MRGASPAPIALAGRALRLERKSHNAKTPRTAEIWNTNCTKGRTMSDDTNVIINFVTDSRVIRDAALHRIVSEWGGRDYGEPGSPLCSFGLEGTTLGTAEEVAGWLNGLRELHGEFAYSVHEEPSCGERGDLHMYVPGHGPFNARCDEEGVPVVNAEQVDRAISLEELHLVTGKAVREAFEAYEVALR